MRYLYCLLVFFVLFISINANAQFNKMGVNVSGAFGFIPIWDEGSGVILGLHPIFKPWKSTNIEELISYSNINKIDIALLGNDRKYQSKNLNLLIGLRQYFNPSERDNKFFLNILGGISREVQIDSKNTQKIIKAAISLGAYYEFKPFLLGIGLESPDYLFVRFGFVVL